MEFHQLYIMHCTHLLEQFEYGHHDVHCLVGAMLDEVYE